MSEKPRAAEAAPTPVETVVIGAGPVGLFQIFELGLLGINAHIIDSLAQAGGQCTELYPDKPIYDIPALPICGAQELIDRLLEQAKPFHATFHLGQEVTELQVLPDGKIHVATSAGTRLVAGADQHAHSRDGGGGRAKFRTAMQQGQGVRLAAQRHRPVESRIAAAADHEVTPVKIGRRFDPIVNARALEFFDAGQR